MSLKCLENGQFQLLGLLPSVFGVQTAKNEFFQKKFFWTFSTDQNDIQKKGSQYFLKIVTFFCLIPLIPSYIFSTEKRKKSKNRPKRKLKKKNISPIGNFGEFFLCVPMMLKIAFHQKLGCYWTIPGSSIFLAEFTGLWHNANNSRTNKDDW